MPWTPGTYPDTRLTDIATSILDRLVARLTLAGIDVPSRRYIHSGQVALDFSGMSCADELVVTFIRWFSGEPGPGGQLPNKPIQHGVPISAVFGVVLARCVPTLDEDGNAPDEAELNDAGERILNDIMSFGNIIADEEFANTLFPEMPYNLTGFGDTTSYGPEGGVGGATMQLFVSLI